jgi:hypothetical protein
MELKLLCGCGQKYKFDVEPVNGQMPFTVACPVCGVDGTGPANAELLKLPPPPLMTPRTAPVAVAAPPPISSAPLRPAKPIAKAAGEYSQAKGIVGAAVGAAVASGLMYGFFVLAGFRFPLLGCGIGAATGWLARVFAKGTDTTLGAIAGALALMATGGTLWLIYGEVPTISIISILVSVSVAFRIAS